MTANRREFLHFLAGSMVLAPSVRAWAQAAAARANGPGSISSVIPGAGTAGGASASDALTSAKDALDVMDFEELARRALPPAHWGYLASGVDDDLTLRANIDAFRRIRLRPRRLVDVSKIDLRTTALGEGWDTPIFLSPVSGQRAFYGEGEIATARAAKVRRHAMVMSAAASASVEDITKALGTPPWFQLYMPTAWNNTERMIKRVEGAGCKVLVWTVDLFGGRNPETMTRLMRKDTRSCLGCHTKGGGVPISWPMFDDMELRFNPPEANWGFVDRLRKLTKMKLVLKGLDTAEDARIALDHGVDGLLVSNHGGRATETLRATIDCLPEVIAAVRGKIPVFVDGGVRRGTDIYKALASGARGVGIGRPYVWGLSAYGQAGVERVLEILRAELTMTMAQMGTPSIADITAARIAR
jgi:4-hydroxymandelate oxidase